MSSFFARHCNSAADHLQTKIEYDCLDLRVYRISPETQRTGTMDPHVIATYMQDLCNNFMRQNSK